MSESGSAKLNISYQFPEPTMQIFFGSDMLNMKEEHFSLSEDA